VRADPFDGDAREILATLEYDTGDYPRAASEGEFAIKYRISPQISTYFTTVSAYVQLKDFAKAETIARAGVAAFPTASRLRLQLAAILADRGDKAGALAIVDAVLVDDPTNADAKVLRQALTEQ
jgi:tetratricopeptide (TPR) repeat protein